MYSEKATKMWCNLLQGWTLLNNVQNHRKIAPIFVAFSENLNL